MRGEQLARQWRTLQRLETAKNGLTVAELAQESAVSLRTVYRDLDDLQLAGFPITCDKEGKSQRWSFVDTYHFKIPGPFTLTELLCLYLAGDLFNVFKETAFQVSHQSLLDKIKAMLAPETLAYMDRLRSAYRMGGGPSKDYSRLSQVIGQINRAVADRKTLEFGYWSLGGNRRTTRRVDAYKIWFYDGTIYVIGHCHLRNEIRTFVVDRINMLHLTDDDFEIPDDFSFENYIRHSFKVMQDELHAVTIRISPAWARWVEEKIWHPSQQIQKLIDGGIEISLKVAGLDEIRQWVLSLGPEAVVLAPEELRRAVRQNLEQTLSQYKEDMNEAFETAILARRSDMAS